MKKQQLKKIIKEELRSVLKEDAFSDMMGNPLKDIDKFAPKSLSQINPNYKSNIALKWKSVNDMAKDLIMWAEEQSEASGPEAIGDMQKALEQVLSTLDKLEDFHI